MRAIIVLSLSSSEWASVIATNNLIHSFFIAAWVFVIEATALVLVIPWSMKLHLNSYVFYLNVLHFSSVTTISARYCPIGVSSIRMEIFFHLLVFSHRRISSSFLQSESCTDLLSSIALAHEMGSIFKARVLLIVVCQGKPSSGMLKSLSNSLRLVWLLLGVNCPWESMACKPLTICASDT